MANEEERLIVSKQVMAFPGIKVTIEIERKEIEQQLDIAPELPQKLEKIIDRFGVALSQDIALIPYDKTEKSDSHLKKMIGMMDLAVVETRGRLLGASLATD